MHEAQRDIPARSSRDFWDLHVILGDDTLHRHNEELRRLLELFAQKYPKVDVGHVVRSLVYFDDAEAEPSPRGLSVEAWSCIQRDLETVVLAL